MKNIFETVGFASFIQEDHLTAVKLHFGEKGNDAFIKPVLVRPVVEKIRAYGAKPFLTDTNTLYYGSRHDSVEHLKTAIMHGFDYAVVGAPVIIADGLLGDNWIPVPVGLKHFHEVKIASDIEISDYYGGFIPLQRPWDEWIWWGNQESGHGMCCSSW